MKTNAKNVNKFLLDLKNQSRKLYKIELLKKNITRNK